MKNKPYIMAMLAMTGTLTASNSNNQGRCYDPTDFDPKKKPIPKGCKEYTFFGHTVIAISEKSARKKCKRLANVR